MKSFSDLSRLKGTNSFLKTWKRSFRQYVYAMHFFSSWIGSKILILFEINSLSPYYNSNNFLESSFKLGEFWSDPSNEGKIFHKLILQFLRFEKKKCPKKSFCFTKTSFKGDFFFWISNFSAKVFFQYLIGSMNHFDISKLI